MINMNILCQLRVDSEFVINSGAHAPESVTRAANSQCQLSVSLIHFSWEYAQFTCWRLRDVIIKNILNLHTFTRQEFEKAAERK